MTCIVSWTESDGTIYMGGDSSGIAETDLRIRKDSKVFIKDDKFIFGFTSSFRMGQLLKYSLEIPKQSVSEEDYQYMCTTFIDSMHELFKEKNYSRIENNVSEGGFFLVGYNGVVYEVEPDFQVAIVYDNFSAIGCGECYALGAMNILKDKNLKPENKIIEALKTANKFSSGVYPPFYVLKLSEKLTGSNLKKTKNK